MPPPVPVMMQTFRKSLSDMCHPVGCLKLFFEIRCFLSFTCIPHRKIPIKVVGLEPRVDA
jgi:hypothetical protein